MKLRYNAFLYKKGM